MVNAKAGGLRDMGSIPGSGDPLEEGMATHSRILAWRIPWTEESGGLQSKGHKESDTTEGMRHACCVTESLCCTAEITTL